MAEEDQNTEEGVTSPAPEGEPGSMDQGGIDAMMGDEIASEDNSDTKPTRIDTPAAQVERKIIQKSMQRFERLPMLDVIFDRLALSLNSTLKTFTTATIEATVQSLEYRQYSAAMDCLPVPSLLAVAHAKPWDNDILVTMDANFLYGALEIMLGGRKSDPAKAEGRSFTGIERQLGEELCGVMLGDLGEAFEQLTQVRFAVSRTETNPQFATICQPQGACIHVQLAVKLDGRKGRIDFVLPYATIEPIRGLLSKVFFGEKLGGDPAWQEHLSDRLLKSSVEVAGVLHEFTATLDEVLGWKAGQTIDLRIGAGEEAVVCFGDHELFQGKVGQKENGSAALRVTKLLEGQKEFQNDLHRR